MTAEIIKLPEPAPQVKVSTFREIGQIYNRYTVTVPVDWELEDVTEPEAWAQIAGIIDKDKQTGRKAQTGSIIEVRTEDHGWYAELYVRAVRPMALDVHVLKYERIGPSVEKKITGFDTRWNVGKQGFDIIRLSDKQIVGDGKDFPKREDALEWIEKMKV